MRIEMIPKIMEAIAKPLVRISPIGCGAAEACPMGMALVVGGVVAGGVNLGADIVVGAFVDRLWTVDGGRSADALVL